MDNISDGITYRLRFSEESLPEGSSVGHDSYLLDLRMKDYSVPRINCPEGILHVHQSQIQLVKVLSISITEVEASSADLFRGFETVIGESNVDVTS